MGCSLSCGHPHLGLLLSFKESFESDMNESNQRPTTGADPEDKRKSARHLITGMVQFKWQAVDGQWYEGIGITSDIGKSGVFIESDSIPSVRSPIKLTVTLPSQSTPNVTLQLSGSGTVCYVRQEPSQRSGFGAAAIFHVDVPMSTGNSEGGER